MKQSVISLDYSLLVSGSFYVFGEIFPPPLQEQPVLPPGIRLEGHRAQGRQHHQGAAAALISPKHLRPRLAQSREQEDQKEQKAGDE